MTLAKRAAETENRNEPHTAGKVKTIDRETIEAMYDEPGDAQVDGKTRFVAVARTLEAEGPSLLPGQTVVLYVDTGANVAFERWFPLPLEWEGIPRSVVVSQNQDFKPLTNSLEAVAEKIVRLYDGVEVNTDKSVDWQPVKAE
jgi:hypothetical protein